MRLRALAGYVVLAAALLAFYVVAYPVFDHSTAIGSDSPVYVWWARRAGAAGLRAADTGGRPLLVGAMAALSSSMHVPTAWVAMGIGPALAAGTGLAMGAFVDRCAGRHRTRFALTAVLTTSFLSLLASGYFSTLAFGLLFVSGLAVLVAGFDGPSSARAPARAAGALFGGAMLAHPVFALLGAGLLGGGMLGLSGGLPGRRHGRSPDGALGKVVAAGAVGVAVAGVGVLATLPGFQASIDTSRDSALARLGLGRLTGRSYRTVLARTFPPWRTVPLVAVAATAIPVLRRSPARGALPLSAGGRLFRGVVVAWVAITAGGVVMLLAGAQIPGQRLAQFCLALPALAGLGLFALSSRGRHGRPATGTRGWARAAGLVGAGAWVVIGWLAWADNSQLIAPAGLSQTRAAASAIASEPPGTPLILVADHDGPDPGRFLVRQENYLRQAVPASRVSDVALFVGRPEDLAAGRPRLTGLPEHDRLATDAWSKVAPLLDRDPVAVVLRAFDPVGFDQGLRLSRAPPDRAMVELGVVFVDPDGGSVAAPAGSQEGEIGPGPISPWVAVWMAPALLGILWAVGLPWARVALGGAGPAPLAPAFGLAAMGLLGMALDLLGIRLGTAAGGTICVVVAFASGMSLLAAGARRGAASSGRVSRRV